MNTSTYAIILSLLLKVLTIDSTYLVTPAFAQVVPRHPLTIVQIYATVPILRTIASCESVGDVNAAPRQFNANGGVLWGSETDPITGKVIVVQRDVGELQINTKAHAAAIAAQNLDIKNDEWDNVWFGYELYKQFGTQPWNASASCWKPEK